ncbi:hypothetical protein OAC17_00465 [Flavobacteriaceae bacterium]|nr:hypothetical protein [Flavobacteriaceae bacterium]MDB4186063.1 hypothetical protein [Flavobacteriaceae bacterium]MDB9821194.1 hypothetical protein [Flavobacteriaceae bacterium]
MNVSIEITLAPLQENYEESIKTFIRTLRNSNFVVQENPLSTQVYGELQPLMIFLTSAIEASFDSLAAGMIHLKIVKSNRSDYVPFN